MGQSSSGQFRKEKPVPRFNTKELKTVEILRKAVRLAKNRKITLEKMLAELDKVRHRS